MSEPRLTHLGEDGSARMVDVGEKEQSERSALARARVRMSPATACAVAAGAGPKGEVLAVARLAGVQAAKQTATLIPLAHPLALTFVDVRASVDEAAGLVELEASARTRGRTGVEMEAMTACAVAALTVYDMVKGVERGVRVEEIVLIEKRGGRSDYSRAEDATPASPAARALAPGIARRGAALLTISTSKAAGEGADESGPALAGLAGRLGLPIRAREVVPDERGLIEERLRGFADVDGVALVLTSGGTGVAPSDVTPEATAAVVERPVPGIGEALRAASRPHTPNWMLSRACAGIRGRTLIVNMPGNPASIEQCGPALEGPLLHALALIAGARPH